MDKLTYGNYDPSIQDVVFDPNKGYVNPANGDETRKQFSSPLIEVRDFINKTVSVNSADKAIQLVVDGNNNLKFRLNAGGALTSVKSTQSDWNVSDSTSDAFIKNKPTIPTVNNGKLTVSVNGTTEAEFSANQSTNTTLELDIPRGNGVYTGESVASGNNYIQVNTDGFANETNSLLFVKIGHVPTGSQVQLFLDGEDTGIYVSKKFNALDYATSSDFESGKVVPFFYSGTYLVMISTGGGSVTVDSALSTSSSNPVRNSAIAIAINNISSIRGMTISAGNTTGSMTIRPIVDHPILTINAYAMLDMSGYTQVPCTVKYVTLPANMNAGTDYTVYVTLDQTYGVDVYVYFIGDFVASIM